MIKFISNMIDKYVYENKELDNDFILNILSKILNEKDLISISFNNNVYLSDITSKEPASMCYRYPIGITIYMESTKYSVSSQTDYMASLLKDRLSNKVWKESFKYYYFIKLIRLLFHEVEHVNQNMRYGTSDELEDLLVDVNIKFVRDFNKLVDKSIIEGRHNNLFEAKEEYEKLYELEPVERFADIKSTNDIDLIINNLNTSDEVKYVLFSLLEFDKLLYKMGSYTLNGGCLSPLQKYIDYLKKKRKFHINGFTSKQLDEKIKLCNDGLTLDERLYYGFEITEQELKILRKRLSKIKNI